MAVPASKRATSKMSFLNNARKINYLIATFCCNDFGTLRKPVEVNRNVTIYEAHSWYIEAMKARFLALANDLVIYVESANSIYPTSPAELEQRRLLQEKAIAVCNTLAVLLNNFVRVLSLSVKPYEHLILLLDKEITVLRGWRKSDMKVFAAFVDLRAIKPSKEQNKDE